MDVSPRAHQVGERVWARGLSVAARPQRDIRMNGQPDVKYAPRHCPFLNKEVWAILTKQADGAWRIVNCLDKHQPCFECPCAFTVDGGDWPFDRAAVDESQLKGRP